MLTYSFADTGNDSLYEYLYKCIKNDILSGALRADEKLPSKRNFAKNLGISTITVENAYFQLMAEGYIYSLPKKGYYVSDIKAITIEPSTLRSMPIQEPSKDEPTYLADFTSNQTDSRYFPFSIWSKLIRELLNDKRQELMTNPPCGGSMYLREAIAGHLKDFHGFNVSPAQVIIGAGTEYLYGILLLLFGNDRKYGVEEPGYDKIARIYKSHHVNYQNIRMDRSGIMIQDLRDHSVDIVHISPSHHFPTGITMTISRRHELLSWAAESPDRYIIEDDYDSEFRFTGQPVPTLQSIDAYEKVIYMNTFTKTLSSTVRIAYMVLPSHLLQEFYRKLSFYSCPVSNFEQYTLGRFIEKGYFEKHINRLRNHYHSKRSQLIRCIREKLPASSFQILKEDAGLHFLMKLKIDISDDAFIERAKKQGIRISSLSRYYLYPPEEAKHTFIMNFTSIKEEMIPEIIDKLFIES